MIKQEAPLFGLRDGEIFIAAAREAIKIYLGTHKIVTPEPLQNEPRYQCKLGCFVTLKQDDDENSLRGCIGFPEPIYKLSQALTEASVHCATQDPRFEPITLSELNSLIIEVSVLSRPTLIEVKSPKDLPSHIKIGKDGLIMRWSFGSGLLLPQVATEQKWDAEEYLTNLSMKAGAMPDQWLVPGTMVLKFQAQVFKELSPKGKVVMEE
jgi:uncharacterized protein (TIGR00296 family)